MLHYAEPKNCLVNNTQLFKYDLRYIFTMKYFYILNLLTEINTKNLFLL